VIELGSNSWRLVVYGYDGHQSHSHYLVLSAGLPGFGPRELALIAQIVRYQRKGVPDSTTCIHSPGPETASWFSAARCCCGWLSCSRSGRTSPSARLGLCPMAVPCSCGWDDRLARWSVERQVGEDVFRSVFGHRLAIAA
jgi:exopolyphosphatase/guanosine-5'-triphosphate,3'-diphosphate pyrophosphatase